MLSYTLLGFTYEADIHCIRCAGERFPELAEDDEATVEDDDGNEVHAYFVSDASEAGGTVYCGDCGNTIYEADPAHIPSPPLGYTIDEEDGEYVVYFGDKELSRWPDPGQASRVAWDHDEEVTRQDIWSAQAAVQNEESDDGVPVSDDAEYSRAEVMGDHIVDRSW